MDFEYLSSFGDVAGWEKNSSSSERNWKNLVVLFDGQLQVSSPSLSETACTSLLKKPEDVLGVKSAISGNVVCPKCKGSDTSYKLVQTRSADEGMTSICSCLGCGHRWTF